MAVALRWLGIPDHGKGCVWFVTPFLFLMYRVSFNCHGSREPHFTIHTGRERQVRRARLI